MSAESIRISLRMLAVYGKGGGITLGDNHDSLSEVSSEFCSSTRRSDTSLHSLVPLTGSSGHQRQSKFNKVVHIHSQFDFEHDSAQWAQVTSWSASLEVSKQKSWEILFSNVWGTICGQAQQVSGLLTKSAESTCDMFCKWILPLQSYPM